MYSLQIMRRPNMVMITPLPTVQFIFDHAQCHPLLWIFDKGQPTQLFSHLLLDCC